MKSVSLFNESKKLRQAGYSLAEISRKLGISKSTASLWLRDVEINPDGQARLKKHSDTGRLSGVAANKAKRQQRWQEMAEQAIFFEKSLTEYTVDQCKVFLAMLYWGEGAKTGRRLIFMNSDPALVKTYLFLLRRSFPIDESKIKATLHLHSYHNQTEMIDFWSALTGINKISFSIYNKANSGSNIKSGYKGCLSIRYGNARILDEIMLIIDRFQQAVR